MEEGEGLPVAKLGACAAEVLATGEAIAGAALWPEHGSSSVIRLRHGGSRLGALRAACSRFIRVHGFRCAEPARIGRPGSPVSKPQAPASA